MTDGEKVGRKLNAPVGADRPPMLNAMVSVFMDNKHSGTTKDAIEAMESCGITDESARFDFKRGYIAGFLYSIGIDRRTMKFTCDVCHKRKAAAKRSANPGPERGRTDNNQQNEVTT